MAWSSINGEMGLIAAGMNDGAVTLWDPYTIVHTHSDKLGHGVKSVQNIHDGFSVNAIEFNPLKPTLLASGGKEVCIHDLSESIKSPTIFTPGEPNYHEGNIVTSISWNRVVQHILASASNDGTVVVWDLKNQKAIFNFKDPELATYDFNQLSG